MERLRDYTNRIAREIETADALATVARFHFDGNKPRRFISGVAISSEKPNVNDDSIVARGVNFSLPTPLLWNHDAVRPLGRVIKIWACADELRFTAEIGNDVEWVDQIWKAIIEKNADMASVEIFSLSGPVIDRRFTRSQVSEISVCQLGADPGAVINRVWERAPCVRLDRPSETVYWERAWR